MKNEGFIEVKKNKMKKTRCMLIKKRRNVRKI